jgi:hypothetical protein
VIKLDENNQQIMGEEKENSEGNFFLGGPSHLADSETQGTDSTSFSEKYDMDEEAEILGEVLLLKFFINILS